MMKIFYPLTKPWHEQLAEWLEDDKIRKALFGEAPIEKVLSMLKDGTLMIAGLFNEKTGHVRGCFVVRHVQDQEAFINLYCPNGLRDSMSLIAEFVKDSGYRKYYFQTRIDRIRGWEKLRVSHFKRRTENMGYEFNGLVKGTDDNWYLFGSEELYERISSTDSTGSEFSGRTGNLSTFGRRVG